MPPYWSIMSWRRGCRWGTTVFCTLLIALRTCTKASDATNYSVENNLGKEIEAIRRNWGTLSRWVVIPYLHVRRPQKLYSFLFKHLSRAACDVICVCMPVMSHTRLNSGCHAGHDGCGTFVGFLSLFFLH